MMKKFFWLLATASTVMALNACSSESDVCKMGETKCDGGKFYSCSIAGKWGLSKDCSASSVMCDNVKGCIECKTVTDCKDTAKPICDVASGLCVGTNTCIANEKSCKAGVYSECNSNGTLLTTTQCGAGEYLGKPICDINVKCVECIDENDCKDPLKSRCSIDNACVFCNQGDSVCEGTVYKECSREGIMVSTQCGIGEFLTKPICDLSAKCVECVENEDCKDPMKTKCSPDSTCVFCIQGESVCDGTVYKECNRDNIMVSTQCGIGEFITKPICDLSAKCVECAEDEDCKDPLKTKCSPDSTCVFCIQGESVCDGTVYKECNRDNIMVSTQCGIGEYVTKPVCDLSAKCVECIENEDCKDKNKPNCSPDSKCVA